MTGLPDIKRINVFIDKIENDLTTGKNISLSILRLDKIHQEISGNKIFKLHYFLENALSEQKKIITFGGAWSNHLAATGGACKMLGIDSIGLVRGEEPEILSHTLSFCIEQGMQLEFISREAYSRKDHPDFKLTLKNRFGDHVLIPEGGYSVEGATGAALISDHYTGKGFTHICCAVGTATTFAGLIRSAAASQTVIGFSALKQLDDLDKRLTFLIDQPLHDHTLITDYHFGGYAKKTTELISFMNEFYKEFAIPTDFVYTGKMMFGIFDLITKNYFPEGSKIVAIHTGGLQGNVSLPAGTLNF